MRSFIGYFRLIKGAGVASILALLLSKKVGDKFVTIDPLPKDFDIKVVAFGVPCCVDYDLSVYSKGLVQSVINGDDIISTISVGLIRDFLNVSAILVKTKGLSESLISRALSGSKVGEENLIDILRLLKSSMNSEKLYPPGDIYWIKSHSGVVIKDRVRNIVKRVEMHECLDVREMFAEPNFSSSMITDHSPAMYHNVLESLVKVACKI